MKIKEIIAIIGATTDQGAFIAGNMSQHNYRLILMSSDAEKLGALKAGLLKPGTKAIIDSTDCAKDSSWEADIIIITSPDEAERQIAEKIKDVATGKIVISISNPLNENHREPVTPSSTSAAEELQKLLPNSKVVKAFAADSSPVLNGEQVDALIAANNGYALEAVMKIMADAGFNPVVVGDLSVSRTLERMQVMRMHTASKNNYNWFANR